MYSVTMWSNEVLHALLIVFVYSNKLTAVDSCEVNADGSGDDNITDIHIIGFFPCTDPNDTRGIPVDNCDGIERIPIMRLALEEINGRCDLLPGYRLVVDYANSAVSTAWSYQVTCLNYILSVCINSSNISSYPTN